MALDYLDPNVTSQQFVANPLWGDANNRNAVQQAINLFAQTFQNQVGRQPIRAEYDDFAKNALYQTWASGGAGSYQNAQALANSYVQTTFPQEVTKNQQAQQTQSLTDTQNTVQNLVNSLNQKTQDYLTNPETQAQIKGQLNNSGMLDSGAYSQTLAGLMSQGATQNEANALAGVSIPALQSIQGLSGIPYQQSIQQGQSGMSNISNLNEFNMQAMLAKDLSSQGQPSGLQQGLGTAFAGMQGGGSLLSGIGNYRRGKG